MDNFFKGCPPMMDDGRLFTDYRSSQVREEIFREKNCAISENEARTIRIEKADDILDDEWDYLRKTRSCFPEKKCYYKNPMTRVTTAYNNAELLAYNGYIPAPECNIDCHDMRATITVGSVNGRPGCIKKKKLAYGGYPPDRCPTMCARTDRLKPDGLYYMEGFY
jgi:hypothetical protein